MSWNSVRAAIEGFLQTNWKATQIEWPNVAFDPSGAAYIRPTLLAGESKRESLTGAAATGHREKGVLMVGVFVPAGGGSGGAYGYCNSLTTLLREQTIGSGAGRAQFLSEVDVSEGESGDPAWFKVNWSMEFEHDVF